MSRTKRAAFRLEPLTPDGESVSGERLPLPGRHGSRGGELFTIRLITQRSAWRNAIALSWAPAGEEPSRVSLVADGARWTFQAGPRRLVLDAASGHAQLIP